MLVFALCFRQGTRHCASLHHTTIGISNKKLGTGTGGEGGWGVVYATGTGFKSGNS